MNEIKRCTPGDYHTLSKIWESSVRATHTFLSENDIQEIKGALEPSYFPNVDLFAITDNGTLTGFVGINGQDIEMLFIDGDCRGQGFGSALVNFAKHLGCTHVDVNEQNPDALRFYFKHGFTITGRDETDDCGRPFPILHMSLKTE